MKTKLTLLGLIVVLTSCTISFDPNGNPMVSADPIVIGQIADKVADKLNETLIDASK